MVPFTVCLRTEQIGSCINIGEHCANDTIVSEPTIRATKVPNYPPQGGVRLKMHWSIPLRRHLLAVHAVDAREVTVLAHLADVQLAHQCHSLIHERLHAFL